MRSLTPYGGHQSVDASSADRPPLVVTSWTPHRSGPLVGFADVLVERWHLSLHDCAVFQSGPRKWAQLPMKPVVGPDGGLRRQTSGKPSYLPAVSFSDERTRQAWSDAVVLAVLRHDPHAFDDAE